MEQLAVWQPIATLPKHRCQVLVTDDDPGETGSGWPELQYGTIELVNCPMLEDGRIMNQNSANYSRPGVWRWWHPVPKYEFKR